ncbi:MAG: NAD(P)H-dependent oxidoreductase subunit E [Candidatus Zapsychrus exili]|nr:NAD(P)H-dependent oxidoreductase subunit E [Candidatus Zapsychrus exili]
MNDKIISQVCSTYNNNKTRMMDIVTTLNKQLGGIDDESIDLIAKATGSPRVLVESTISFYSFLSKDKKGDVVVRLCNDVVDNMQGAKEIKEVFEQELGIKCGETTEDGKVTLEETPCIGMCDQAPAALINETVVTSLTKDKAKQVAQDLKGGAAAETLVKDLGDGNNANDLVKSMVNNNVKKKGEVIFADREDNVGLKAAIEKTPESIIEDLKISKLRGRGGAGFPTGLKWAFTRSADGDNKTVICNADEGEPGTFKDRVILTEECNLLFEGMTIGGYVIGAETGIIYLRGEYAYLKVFLEDALDKRREANLLGKNILGKDGFNFDIRIQLGAGAYICGEESSLISSCEGLRGDPKTRPPFPAQKGYLQTPTAVNNVETFCSVARILEKGGVWFAEIGTEASPGTKLLSISGDCDNPGVYEFEFGVTINDMLSESGAKDTKAVLVGGPSGQIIGKDDFDKAICYDDLATGGAIVVFNSTRDILKIALEYMEFFVEESCGYCTPCRAGNVLLRNCLENIVEGKGQTTDLKYLEELGESVQFSSRCGLGQTSPNPILSTLKNFKADYEALVKEDDGFNPAFDINKALSVAEDIQGRKSVIFNENH